MKVVVDCYREDKKEDVVMGKHRAGGITGLKKYEERRKKRSDDVKFGGEHPGFK